MENQSIIERYKADLKFYEHASQAMVDFSKMSVRGAMLLNGAGIIPIVYSKVDYLYDSALFFGWGALAAACATGATYLTQWAITAACARPYTCHPFRTSPLGQEEEKAVRAADQWMPRILPLRLLAIALVCASLVLFGAGLYSAHSSINTMQSRQELPAPKAEPAPKVQASAGQTAAVPSAPQKAK